jgi:DNA (cytosine-5)-methyltransferase 1
MKRLLDLFCGAGGAGMGYHRAGFEVVGVDIKPQKHYPFEFHQADALEYLAEHGAEFDVIHASPPCQRYSCATPKTHRGNHPDLIDATRLALMKSSKPWIIENVGGARKVLHSPMMLCGTMFGINLFRHRYFEIYPPVFWLVPPCRHDFHPIVVSGHSQLHINGGRVSGNSIEEDRQAMGIDWMSSDEITLAIPPAYTEWIGKRIMELMP